MMRRNVVILVYVFILVLGCNKKDDGPSPPTAAELIFPEDNSECTEGVDINADQTLVTFRWNASSNTSNYEITLENLVTGIEENFNTTATSFDITLDKLTQYRWFVTSSSSEFSEGAQSETWQFVNSGGIESYAPFPAELISPNSGAGLLPGNINLIWTGNDVDDDITGYDVLLDNVNPPVTIIEDNISSESAIALSLASGIYYWRIVTRDSEGNTSESPVYQFQINDEF